MHSQPQPFRFICLPPAPLRPLVRYFHVECTGACRVMVPASPYPMLGFFISGGSVTDMRGYSEAMVCGPLTTAVLANWLPGTCFISAVCHPAGFGELLGVDLRALRDCPVPLAEAAPGLPALALLECLRAGAGPAQWVADCAAWLMALAREREERVLRAFAVPASLLMAPSGELAQQFGLSVRQFERRHAGAYGLTLREARSMARYTRALGMLLCHGARRGSLTGVACAAGYHDQAHMIHDFRRFLGVAPGNLLGPPGPGGDDLWRLLRYDAEGVQIVAGTGC